MSTKVELYKKYVKLVQQGKKEEAHKVLQERWSLDKQEVVESDCKTMENTQSSKGSKVKKGNGLTFDSLVKIKGIGKKTVEELKKSYSTMEKLQKALISDKVSLRDDLCNKLKKELI